MHLQSYLILKNGNICKKTFQIYKFEKNIYEKYLKL